MANTAYLLNTVSPASTLLQGEAGPANLWTTGPVYKIPVPWLCCFRPEDLHPVVVPLEDGDGNAVATTIRLPRTTVAQAVKNLEQALPLFEQITGEKSIAHEYWRAAVADVRALPLPWLALDPIEIVAMFDLEGSLDDLALALAGDSSALPYLKDFAGYEDGALPYPHEALTQDRGLVDEDRTGNAVALDMAAGAVMWDRMDAMLALEQA